MKPPRPQPATSNREPIYRTIRALMLFDLLLGLFLALFGERLFGIPGLTIAGIVLAVLGAGLFVVFGRLAARAGPDGPSR